MNIVKLGSGGALTPDTCNGARNIWCLIVEKVHEAGEGLRKDDSDNIPVLEVDCWNHLRNVLIGGTTKTLYTLLGNIIREWSDKIDLQLRVLTRIKSVLCAVNKKSSLCDNYPKGHGELFREWIETYHHGVLLFHMREHKGPTKNYLSRGRLCLHETPLLDIFLGQSPADAQG